MASESLAPAPADAISVRPARPQGHLPALDGVRGFAILMVLCSHAFESNYIATTGLTRAMGFVFYYGLFGVDLFFVLSGFLITGILFDSLSDPGYFRKFYIRRALRIFPLYYGVLLVCFLLTRPLHLHWGAMGVLLPLYLQNLRPVEIMLYSPGGGIRLYHFWSLAVEEQFYLIWPAVVFLVRGRSALLRTTLIASGVALVLRLGLMGLGVSPFWMHVSTPLRADSLLLGGTLALLYRSPAWEQVQRYALRVFLLLAVVVNLVEIFIVPYLEPYPWRNALWHEGLRYSLLAVGFAGLIAWALRSGSAGKRFFEWSGLRFLGKYSYGIYVLHIFVLSALNLPLRAAITDATHSKAVGVGVAGVVSLAAAVCAAWLSYHLYERPFLRLKHSFDYQRASLNQGAPEDAPETPSGA